MLIKIIFIGITLCLINVFLKKQSSEFVLPVEIIFLALSTSLIIGYIEKNLSWISEAIGQIQDGEEIFTSAVKGVCICLITKVSSDICTESGNRLIGDIIEFTGRLMLLIISAPYISSIINIAFAFVK